MSKVERLLVAIVITAIIILIGVIIGDLIFGDSGKTDASDIMQATVPAEPMSNQQLYCINEETKVYIRSAETEKLDIPGIIIIPADGLKVGVPALITIRDKNNVPHDCSVVPISNANKYRSLFNVRNDAEVSTIIISFYYSDKMDLESNLYSNQQELRLGIYLKLTPEDFKSCYSK